MRNLIPLILFLVLFILTGSYFTYKNVDYAFYQISPVVMLIPSIVLAIVFSGKNGIDKFVSGMADRQIIAMIIIFLLSGAFTAVTKSIGGVNSIVNLILSFTSSRLIIPGIFIISAVLGTAMGTSMGVIAAVTPIAMEIAKQIGGYESICVATVIGGAMFGDNLSLISDTTVAAVKSQSASLVGKFKINLVFSSIAALLTLLLLMFYRVENVTLHGEYSIINIIPYLFVIGLALFQVHVFVVLIIGILLAGLIGLFFVPNYNVVSYSQDIYGGFLSVNEVALLSLLIGGLIHLAKINGLSSVVDKINRLDLSRKTAKFVISGLVSIADILLANNTIAILVTGSVAKDLAKKNKIQSHESAFLLDSFSCVFQGIIPHGAQIILASSLSGVNLLLISSQVFFCYIMAVIMICYIVLSNK
ncbi:MAG: hypothetical protein HRK26_02195 [Rickettsiaceae bacterium H1]|nr:hypothetical protein [Rickettsiaceae bacterium H1]